MPPLSSITLLSPLPAIVAASIAIPLLLFLYFLKLRRRPARVSSTLLWQSAARDLQVNAPFRVIRPSWILLLQLLALLCFLIALGRPAIEADPNAGADSGGGVIILIDNSASMSAPSGTGDSASRLDEAIDQASRLTRRLPSGSQVMLVTVAAEPITRVAFTRNRAEIVRSIETIQPTDQPADLPAAVELLRAFTASSSEDPESASPPRVLFFSDGNPPAPGAQTSDANPDLAAALASINLEFVSVGPAPSAQRDNLAITALAARRDEADPALIRVYARLQSTLPRAIEPPLICRVGDQLVLVPKITLPAATEQSVSTVPLSFTTPAPTTDSIPLTLSLSRADDLASDNAAAITIEPPSSLRILYVHPNSRLESAIFKPEDALSAFEPEALESITLSEYERRIDSPANLLRHSVVIFDAVRPTALPPVPTISFASPLPLPAVGLSRYEESDPNAAPTPFIFWKRTHPLLRYCALDAARITNHMRLTLPSESAPADAPTATIIATGRSAPLIALLDDKSIPRVITAFPLATEPWLREPAFHIFLANALEFLTLSAAPSSRARTTLDTFTLRPAPGAQSISIAGPAPFSKPIDPATATVSVGPFPLVGVYSVEGANLRSPDIPINLLHASESAIATSNSLTIASTTTPATSIARAALREIWHYFVAAALVLLTIEWLVVARRMKL